METPYSISDKLSVVNQKIWHAEEIAHDPSSTDKQVAESKRRINVLNTQRNDLMEEGDELIRKLISGDVELKVFRQCKDYTRGKK